MANQMHAFKKMRPEPETFKAALPSWFIAAVNHVAKLWEERERKLQRLFGSHNSCVCVHSGLIKYRKMCNLGKPYCFGSEDKINGFKKKSNRAVTKRPSEEIKKPHLF